MSDELTKPFTLGVCTLAFPNLVTPSKPPGSDGEAKYNTAIVISGDLYASQIKPRIDGLIAQKFTNGETANPRFSWGVLPCTSKPQTYPAELTQGMYYFNAKSERKPELVDGQQQPLIDPGLIRDGAQAYVSINIYTFNKAGNVGFGIGLGPVMYVSEGVALNTGGGPSANQAFAGIQVDPAMAPAPAMAAPAMAAPAMATPAAPMAPSAPMAPAAPAAPAPVMAAPAAPAATPAPTAAPMAPPAPPVQP